MWRKLRIAILLVILGMVAWSTWYDRLSTTDWDETLYVGVFPIDDAGNEVAREYIHALSDSRIAETEKFLNDEARRFGILIARPVRVQLYPVVEEAPPARQAEGNFLQDMLWSLKLRMYARRASRASGRPPPQVRIFVIYHDPAFNRTVPHSVGMQKGLVGVVHAYADRGMSRANNVVIAHEILHTLGASDKYDPETLAPLFPIGFAEPDLDPTYPQTLAEIMAGRYAVDSRTFTMPDSLDEIVVGSTTALEIGWKRP